MIVRSTNNFGPRQFPEKIISLFITNALQGKKLPVYGDGQNVRDWLYVLDNCQAIDFIIHKGKVGEIYNVAGNNEMKNIDLTRLILKIIKKIAFGDNSKRFSKWYDIHTFLYQNKSEDLIEYVKDRPGHDRRYALDCAKIAELGWRPVHNFEQALTETVEWYRKNTEWWQDLVTRR